MNIRRGFFRLWIVLSLIWFAGCAAFQSSAILNPSLIERVYVLPSATADFYKLDNIFDQFDDNMQKNHWSINFPNNVKLLVHNDVSKAIAEARNESFYEQYSKPRENEVVSARVAALITFGLIGVIPPLGLLIFGWVIGWSLSGFKSDNANKDAGIK
jgi:hypothetical protein